MNELFGLFIGFRPKPQEAWRDEITFHAFQPGASTEIKVTLEEAHRAHLRMGAANSAAGVNFDCTRMRTAMRSAMQVGRGQSDGEGNHVSAPGPRPITAGSGATVQDRLLPSPVVVVANWALGDYTEIGARSPE